MTLLEKRGQLLRELLLKKNMQVKELAQLMCVSSQAVTNWLYGKNEIASDKILDLCDIFNITSDEYLNAELKPSSMKEINKRKVDSLSSEDKIKIIDDFSSGLSKKDIEKKYNIILGKITVREAIGSVQIDVKCPNCGSYMITKLGTRRKRTLCNNCGHEENVICKCSSCVDNRFKEKELIEEQNKKILYENINLPLLEPNYDEEKYNIMLIINNIISTYPEIKENLEIDTRTMNISNSYYYKLFDKGYITISKSHINDSFAIKEGKIVPQYANFSINYKVNFDINKFYEGFKKNKERIISDLIKDIKSAILYSYIDYLLCKSRKYRLYPKVTSNDKINLINYFNKYSYSQFCVKLDWILNKFEKSQNEYDKNDKIIYSNQLISKILRFFDVIEEQGKEHFENKKVQINEELNELMSLSNAKKDILFVPFTKINSDMFDL